MGEDGDERRLPDAAFELDTAYTSGSSVRCREARRACDGERDRERELLVSIMQRFLDFCGAVSLLA